MHRCSESAWCQWREGPGPAATASPRTMLGPRLLLLLLLSSGGAPGEWAPGSGRQGGGAGEWAPGRGHRGVGAGEWAPRPRTGHGQMSSAAPGLRVPPASDLPSHLPDPARRGLATRCGWRPLLLWPRPGSPQPARVRGCRGRGPERTDSGPGRQGSHGDNVLHSPSARPQLRGQGSSSALSWHHPPHTGPERTQAPRGSHSDAGPVGTGATKPRWHPALGVLAASDGPGVPHP